MSWWSEKPQATLAPAIEPPINRVAQTLSRVTRLKSELARLDAAMREFKTANRITTDRYGRLLGVRCAEVNGRDVIEKQWRELLKQRDGLVTAWHKALFEWAAAKQEKK
jgi:hypothetical protein